jgi:hypothetical protein
VKFVYPITGSCPITEAEIRLEMAALAEAEGRDAEAEEWRAIVDKMRAEWADRTEAGRTRRSLSRSVGADPDALVTPFASPGHPVFWHLPRRDDSVSCPCGHFADFLCDQPVGSGTTCDRGICKCCRVEVGEFDQCGFHAQTKPRQEVTRRRAPTTRRQPRLRLLGRP